MSLSSHEYSGSATDHPDPPLLNKSACGPLMLMSQLLPSVPRAITSWASVTWVCGRLEPAPTASAHETLFLCAVLADPVLAPFAYQPRLAAVAAVRRISVTLSSRIHHHLRSYCSRNPLLDYSNKYRNNGVGKRIWSQDGYGKENQRER